MPSQKVPHAQAPFNLSLPTCVQVLAEIIVPHPGKKMLMISKIMCIGDLTVGTSDPQHDSIVSLSL